MSSSLITKSPCPYRKLDPGVLMVKPTENFDRGDPSDAVNGSVKRCVLVKREMSPRGVVVGLIGLEDSAKMSFSDDHDVIEIFTSDRAISAWPFCHGDCGAVGRSRIPIARS